VRSRSDLQDQTSAGVHHRRAPGVDGRDDLLDIDPLQIGAGGRQLRVAELALNQRQRNPFVQQLDSVRMPELMWGYAPAHACLDGELVQLEAHGAG
jgi:hypothetical protein